MPASPAPSKSPRRLTRSGSRTRGQRLAHRSSHQVDAVGTAHGVAAGVDDEGNRRPCLQSSHRRRSRRPESHRRRAIEDVGGGVGRDPVAEPVAGAVDGGQPRAASGPRRRRQAYRPAESPPVSVPAPPSAATLLLTGTATAPFRSSWSATAAAPARSHRSSPSRR